MWNKYQEQYQNDDRLEQVPWVDNKMQENGDLVKMIDNLYA